VAVYFEGTWVQPLTCVRQNGGVPGLALKMESVAGLYRVGRAYPVIVSLINVH
jgi:hypothetical protein